MKVKHSPGPWKADGSKIYSVAPYNQRLIAECNQLMINVVEIGNAKLIAAAPEMLLELKRLRELLQNIQAATGHHFDVSIKLTQLVIDKAEGTE